MKLINRVIKWGKKNILYFAWVAALAATLGSLYASEYLRWIPCNLCWYQRILVYPLGLIIPVGILLKDKNLPYYVIPLTVLGMGISLYQHLLQVGIIPEQLAPCSFGISCATKYFDLYNFITLPFLSFLAFAFIAVCMVIFARKEEKKL